MSERAPQSRSERLLELADDELILGWRNSEWTGIAPFLEEDVAFSSIAQNEIGHARALYELAARDLGTDADSLAFDRSPAEYRCAPLVQLRLVEDWAATIARHYLYETADRIRLEDLQASDDAEVAGLAAKMDREEARFVVAVDALWPQALGLLEPARRGELAARVGRDEVEAVEREVTDEFDALWQEMTSVRRSAPAGAQW